MLSQLRERANAEAIVAYELGVRWTTTILPIDVCMVQSVVIRSATPADAEPMADLLTHLGYPATASEVLTRLAHVDALGSAVVLVAELDSDVVGLATGHLFPSIHMSPPAAWLTTLVVAEQHARRGIGRRLSGAVEFWARSHGAVRLSVTSGIHRDGAHAFYEHIGYERTGLRLTKTLGEGSSPSTCER